jgi:glycosyltransferase involved in cell wall biosynthesis
MILDQITPLILTYNEAANIGRTLEQLRWANRIVVVDSFSNDETLDVVSGFPQVSLFQRHFDTHQAQWNFALQQTGITSEWVLALDADYVLTEECIAELASLVPAAGTQGYSANFVYCINGRRLKSGVYPPVTILYRRARASYLQDGHTQRLVLNGSTEKLAAPILHDDRKPLKQWFQAQIRYTELEARKLLTTEWKALAWRDRIRRWHVVAPTAMLFHCLVIRGGMLDGWPGLYYAFQRSLAELMLSLRLLDNKLNGAGKSKEQRAKSEVLRVKSEGAKSKALSAKG